MVSLREPFLEAFFVFRDRFGRSDPKAFETKLSGFGVEKFFKRHNEVVCSIYS
jgi:hypothetical protein